MSNIWAIIVTYNGSEWIEKCLCSLEESTQDINILVIDNNSSDGTGDIVMKHPLVHYKKMSNNWGFGKANNIGIDYVLKQEAEYVLLLNQDAWIEKDMVKKLVELHRSNKDYGILSPLHLNGKGTALDFGFSQYTDCGNTIDKIERQEVLYPVDFINAAIWLLPTEIFHIVGGFDPVYPHYGEDSDFVNRLHYHRYKVGYSPSCIGFHDRVRKIESEERRIASEYLYFLSVVKDINLPFVKSVIKMLFNSTYNGIRNSRPFPYLKIQYRILKQLKTIYRTREYVKKRGAAFLKYNKDV